ncbi:FAD:protein FMN transferase, partial [Isoptericola sp. b441]
MASQIELRVVAPQPGAARAVELAADRIRAVARHLTRFEETSALSRANAAPSAWHEVPRELAAAVEEARRAYLETGGLFDPRVLDALLGWGYDRTFSQVPGVDPAALPCDVAGSDALAYPVPDDPWEPTVLPGRDGWGLLHLGGTPIDLGGIGKGLAVRWATDELRGAGSSVLVDAGGDE